ncbi:MAG: Uridine kinase [Vezdaea acicularis]|nr:MAG: Uridine kinase [Vezdaea acicularis]
MPPAEDAHYVPPWANTSIIGISGASGSGKTSLAVEIVSSLNLPWVVILSMDAFYKPLNKEEHELAHRNEYDFDSPNAIDFDTLVSNIRDLKQGKRAEIPIYSFSRHQREEETTSIYAPHVLILEGIFALYSLKQMRTLVWRGEVSSSLWSKRDRQADSGLVTRDVRTRGRDIEGCIKQWFAYVKPNFERYVQPQRTKADIIVPRGIENKVAIDMVVKHIQRTLREKSEKHSADLQRLGKGVVDEPLGEKVLLMKATPQLVGMSTILHNPNTGLENFIFYFDRLATLLIERAMDNVGFRSKRVTTPRYDGYNGLTPAGEVSAVVVLRGGSALESGLKRVIPSCSTGRILVQSSFRTGEPELHYLKLPEGISSHESVLLLDAQMSSGGAALMAVRVLLDHGVQEGKIVLVTYLAGRMGLNRLTKVYPQIKVVVGEVIGDFEERWVEERYFGC